MRLHDDIDEPLEHFFARGRERGQRLTRALEGRAHERLVQAEDLVPCGGVR
jgi:hypothetical protein